VSAPELGTGARAYLRLLRYPPALAPFASALVARLSISMAPLGLLLLVQAERGAYGIAGFVTGSFAVGCAAGTPLWGRAMDRFGQVKTLIPTSLISAGFLAGCALAAALGAPLTMLLGLAAAAGVSYPPISPAMRAAWRAIFPDPAARRVAFALDATSVELLFVAGPLVLSVLLAFTNPVVPVLVTAGCIVVGGIAYCRTDAARVTHLQPARHSATPNHGVSGVHRSAITVPGIAAVLAAMLSLSIGFGQVDTSLAGTAGKILGSTDRVGILFTAVAGGSGLGGLIYGARNWSRSEHQTLPMTTVGFAILLASVAGLIGTGTVHLWLMLVLLFGAGLMIAASLIMQQRLMDQLAPLNRLNEAQSMLSAMTQVGGAVGTAIAGVLIDAHGVSASFAGAACAAGISCVVAVASQRHWLSALTSAHRAASQTSGSAA
jgi:MFS family permease